MSDEKTKRPETLSEKAKELFSAAWSWSGENIAPEFGRLGRQGAMELASALFNGRAFTPYGPGAYTKDSKDKGMKGEGVHGPQEEPQTPEHGLQGQERERGGRGM